MQPEFEDEEAIDPFDFWTGANFKLKAKNVAGYRNYDSSEFATPSQLLDDDDALEAIWNKEYSLQEFVSPDKFKSYNDLKKRLDTVLGSKSKQMDEEVEDEDDYRGPARELDDDLRSQLNNLSPSNSYSDDEEEDYSDLSYFKKLASED